MRIFFSFSLVYMLAAKCVQCQSIWGAINRKSGQALYIFKSRKIKKNRQQKQSYVRVCLYVPFVPFANAFVSVCCICMCCALFCICPTLKIIMCQLCHSFREYWKRVRTEIMLSVRYHSNVSVWFGYWFSYQIGATFASIAKLSFSECNAWRENDPFHHRGQLSCFHSFSFAQSPHPRIYCFIVPTVFGIKWCFFSLSQLHVMLVTLTQLKRWSDFQPNIQKKNPDVLKVS